MKFILDKNNNSIVKNAEICKKPLIVRNDVMSAPKIVVIGNCQSQFIEGMIKNHSEVETSWVPFNFMLKQDDRDIVESAVKGADFVFVQRTADDFWIPWASSKAIKSIKPEQTFIWPNLYFDGFFPGTQYLYLKNTHKIEGPMEDYHFSVILEAHRKSLTKQEAIQKLINPEINSRDPFKESIKHLTDREADCDIIISDAVSDSIHQRQCFYTPNHPDNALLFELSRRIAAAMGVNLPNDSQVQFGATLDRIKIPIFPWISKMYDLKYSTDIKFRGVEYHVENEFKTSIGPEKYYNAAGLVEAYYHLYDNVCLE